MIDDKGGKEKHRHKGLREREGWRARTAGGEGGRERGRENEEPNPPSLGWFGEQAEERRVYRCKSIGPEREPMSLNFVRGG